MTDSFLPFQQLIDPGRALRILRDATDGADDGELFLERTRSESLVFDDRRLRNAGYGAAQGFGLRAVRGEVTGYAHSTDISEAALRDAADTARLAVGAGGGIMAPAPGGPGPALYQGLDPVQGIDFAARVATLRDIDAYARDLDPRVVQVTASLASSLQEIAILRPEGGIVTDIRPMARLNVSVIVESNARRESGSAGGGGRHGLSALMDPAHWQGLVAEALRIARLEAENRRLAEENTFLKKAAAFFAKDFR